MESSACPVPGEDAGAIVLNTSRQLERGLCCKLFGRFWYRGRAFPAVTVWTLVAVGGSSLIGGMVLKEVVPFEIEVLHRVVAGEGGAGGSAHSVN